MTKFLNILKYIVLITVIILIVLLICTQKCIEYKALGIPIELLPPWVSWFYKLIGD